MVNGQGALTSTAGESQLDLYDVLLASPEATAPMITAGETELTFLSFYLPPFMNMKPRHYVHSS